MTLSGLPTSNPSSLYAPSARILPGTGLPADSEKWGATRLKIAALSGAGKLGWESAATGETSSAKATFAVFNCE